MRRQHALITTAQASSVGVGRELCSDLVRRGIWERPCRGLYGPVGVAWTWRRRLMAAVLLAPERSLISHRSAAALLGVGGFDAPMPEITIPRGTRLRRPGIVVHESTDLHLAEVRRIDGIPITGPRRLAMDLGAVVSEARYRQSVRELRMRHRITSQGLLHTYLRHKRSGRDGGGALRAWLDRYYAVEGVPESGLELVVLDALIDAGLPAPVAQHWVRTPIGAFRLDLAWPDLRIAVEVDGRLHGAPDVTAVDARRDAALEALGWTIIRVRSWSLTADLRWTIDRLRSVVTLSGAP